MKERPLCAGHAGHLELGFMHQGWTLLALGDAPLRHAAQSEAPKIIWRRFLICESMEKKSLLVW